MADLVKTDALLDELLKDCRSPEDILGKHGLLKQLTQRLVERALAGELTAHLGYEPHEKEVEARDNTRNGHSAKRLQTETGPLPIEVPRDRVGSFEPQLVKKHQRRLAGLDDVVLSLYARGLSTREIQGHLEELYGTAVSPTLISQVTDAVLEEIKVWQNRPLEALYPILYLDALMVKSREDGTVRNRAVYVALGVTLSGHKELLGLWIAPTEGAKFWLSVLTELKNRGMQDCFIACVDGLTGFPEAIETVLPQTQVQLCLVHKVRNSLTYVSYKDRRAVAKDLKAIYTAPTLAGAEQALEVFADTWDKRYPAISSSWLADWERLIPLFEYPLEIRRVVYTTNAIESLNRSLRRVLKTRGAFPTDEAIRKVLYLALQNAAKTWSMPIANWNVALNQFAILFADRMPK
jgi:putative transposase